MSQQYPPKPTCHGEKPRFAENGVEWREGREHRQGQKEPFRRCSYCGSIHPEDLVNFLKSAQATMGGSDWKYGYPHKFYVDIVNPGAGTIVPVGGTHKGITQEEYDALSDEEKTKCEIAEEYRNGVLAYKTIVHIEPFMGRAGNFGAKFYAEHLKDEGYSPEALKELLELIYLHTDIRFSLEDGKLKYLAPYRGYQRP